MDQDQLNSSTKGFGSAKFKKKGLSPRAIIAIALVIVVVLFTVGFATGLLYFGVKSPNEKVVVRSTACDELVDEYVKEAAEGAAISRPSEVFANLVDKIPDNDAARNDPNCQFIRLYDAFLSANFDGALGHANNIKTLLDDGLPLDARLPLFGSIDGMIRLINIQKEAFNLDFGGGSSVD